MAVEVQYDKVMCRVSPSCANVLAEALTYWRKDWDPRTGATFEKRRLYRDTPQGLVTYTGMMGRILKVLSAAGVSFNVTRLYEPKVPPADFTLAHALRPEQAMILPLLDAHERGMFDAPAGVGKSHLLRDICRVWPDRRVLICSPSAAVARQTFENCRREFPVDEVGLVGAGGRDGDRRIVSAVFDSVLKCDLSKVDILLLDEIHRAAADKHAETFLQAPCERKFGLSANTYGRGDKADLRMEAMTGPLLLKVAQWEAEETGSIVPIRVRVLDCSRLQRVDVSDSWTRDRYGVWRHKGRNRLIAAAVAHARSEFGAGTQILVSVKTSEHIAHLHALIPDFGTVYASADAEKCRRWVRDGLLPDTHPLSQAQRFDLVRDFSRGRVKCVVGTESIGTGVDVPALQVLIRGDALSSIIGNTQWPGRVARSHPGKEFGCMYDFDDSHCEDLNKRWLVREAIYKSKGWRIDRIPWSVLAPYMEAGNDRRPTGLAV